MVMVRVRKSLVGGVRRRESGGALTLTQTCNVRFLVYILAPVCWCWLLAAFVV